MKVQYEHEVISSFLMFLDHEICYRGKAYTNYGSNFYPISGNWVKPDGTKYYTYASPFKQFVYDETVSYYQSPTKKRIANVISGVYLDNAYTVPGENGLLSIDHNNGQLHFDTDSPALMGVLPSGDYAVKDFNIYLTNEPENVILFETQYTLNPKTNQEPEGLPTEHKTYPAIFIKNQLSRNEEAGFPDYYQTEMYLRAIVLADSAYGLDAVCGLMKDMTKRSIPIISSNEQPFGALGWTGGANVFNYSPLATQTDRKRISINDVNVSKKSQNKSQFKSLNAEVFVGFVDFTLIDIRNL